MKKKLLYYCTNRFFICVLLSCFSIFYESFAQENIDKVPHAYRNADIAKKMNIPSKIFSLTKDLNEILKEDSINEFKNKPMRFGYPIDVALSLENSGAWTELANGDRIWNIEIVCPSAKTINFIYDKLWIPSGATMYIYNKKDRNFIGEFSSINNVGRESSPSPFSTTIVSGNKVIIEYYEPLSVKNKGVISIEKIIYGYRDLNEINLFANNDCQVDVNCSPEGDKWQDVKKAITRIIINGAWLCTGCLINNTAEDGTFYVLTANHCLKGADAVNGPNLSSFVFDWNYEKSSCKSSNVNNYFSTYGASVISNNDYTDFALLKLIETPDKKQVYFAGWDRQGVTSNGVGIHHPGGREKKIATYTSSPTDNGRNWFLYWAQTVNGFSVMEGGSSGSPLLNQYGRIVGQLFGGGDVNCNDPKNDHAVYGKFSHSWDAQSLQKRRLSIWLDPINSNKTSMNGACLSEIFVLNKSYTSNTTINDCIINFSNIKISSGVSVNVIIGNKLSINNSFEIPLGASFSTN